MHTKLSTVWPLFVLLCRVAQIVGEFRMSDRDAIGRLEVLPAVSSGVPVTVTCGRNFTLEPGAKIIWKAAGGKSLSNSSVINGFKPLDDQHRAVQLKVNEGQTFVYLFCVDPRTQNVIRGFQIQHNVTYVKMYKTMQTLCPLHPDYYTIINCRYLFIPPVAVETCYWRSSLKPDVLRRDSSVLTLGLRPVEDELGWYTCECARPRHHGDELLMNFSVPLATNDPRDIADYQFCQHVHKHLPTLGVLGLTGVTDGLVKTNQSDTAKSTISDENDSALIAVSTVLGVITVCLFVVVVFLWRTNRKRHVTTNTLTGQNSPAAPLQNQQAVESQSLVEGENASTSHHPGDDGTTADVCV